MTWSAIRDHLFQVIAGAAVLGGGGMLVTNQVSLARQDERIKTIEAIPATLDEIKKAQATTNERLAAIETKLEK